MNIDRLLSHWRADPSIASNIVEWRVLPAYQPVSLPLPEQIQPALIKSLESQGISRLYHHQVQSWEHSKKGEHVVLVTGTASGKSLAYNLSTLDRLLVEPRSRALYLFPTKALAQDQFTSLRKLIGDIDSTLPDIHKPTIAVYDGDTPGSHKLQIRTQARIVLSNPDMLHAGVLPYHTKWAEFFSNLSFIILDEIHTYRGVFGSHVANVIRRLERVSRFYGSTPQYFLTSATIANPREHAEKLIGAPAYLVDRDSSSRGLRNFIIYNPPVVDPELGLRRSVLQETIRLADDLLHHDIQSIIFGRSRRSIEVMLKYLKEQSETGINSHDDQTISGYRSGYLKQERREIERGLREGDVRIVVSTNALELGIDIGTLDAALIAGYPGTIAATWQQGGRAGRSDKSALIVLLTSANPLDQFLAHNPKYFFGQSPEHALINPDHLLILLDQIQCAAYELPFRADETFGEIAPGTLLEFLDYLASSGILHKSNNKYFWMSEKIPTHEVSLRSASANRIALVSDSEVIGEVDMESAAWMVHSGAVYLHQAQSYLVDTLDLANQTASLTKVDTDYYTIPRTETTVSLDHIIDSSPAMGAIRSYGELIVSSQVVGFRKVQWYTHETLGYGDLVMPETVLNTTGYWVSLLPETVDKLRMEGLWSSDPNRYGPNWDLQRQLTRERDQFRCQVCGVAEFDISHHVHHKIPFRAFNSYLEANLLDNLITLCPSCHRRVETAARIRSGLSGLAFTLGNLAPFFLMCDTNDLGVHSDPRSSISDGNPTIVIYDRVPAGIGFSQKLFEIHSELMEHAYNLVKRCECTDGCPSCVGPSGESGIGGKHETTAILELLCE